MSSVAAQILGDLAHVELEVPLALDLVEDVSKIDDRVRHLRADVLDRRLGLRAHHQRDADGAVRAGAGCAASGAHRAALASKPELREDVALSRDHALEGGRERDRPDPVEREQRRQRLGRRERVRRPLVEPRADDRAVGRPVLRILDDESHQRLRRRHVALRVLARRSPRIIGVTASPFSGASLARNSVLNSSPASGSSTRLIATTISAQSLERVDALDRLPQRNQRRIGHPRVARPGVRERGLDLLERRAGSERCPGCGAACRSPGRRART